MAARRADWGRPQRVGPSSSPRVWMHPWIGSRTNVSKRSHIGLNEDGGVVVCGSMAVPPFWSRASAR
jgi:hypothetical protein